MPEIDYAVWDFIDADGKPRQLRFRRNYAAADDPRIFDGTGQLIAVIVDAEHDDNGDEIAVSAPNVRRDDVETALNGWQDWATLYVADDGIDRCMSLSEVQRRMQRAGLACQQPQ